jgi:hypothetical protein
MTNATNELRAPKVSVIRGSKMVKCREERGDPMALLRHDSRGADVCRRERRRGRGCALLMAEGLLQRAFGRVPYRSRSIPGQRAEREREREKKSQWMEEGGKRV